MSKYSYQELWEFGKNLRVSFEKEIANIDKTKIHDAKEFCLDFMRKSLPEDLFQQKKDCEVLQSMMKKVV